MERHNNIYNVYRDYIVGYSRRISRLLLCALLCGMASGTAYAQFKTDSIHALNEVVVDARHRQILRSTAPLQVLAKGEMLKLGVTDIADALHRLPGINLRDYGGAGGMKTVAVRGFGAQHTGVSYDGILLSESQGGEIDVSRYSLDQVQTLRLTVGDNDDIFIPARQASVPAVLAIETMEEEPKDKRVHLTSQVKVGSFGFVSPFARYMQRLSDGFTLSAMGEYTYAENDYPFVLHNGTFTTKEHRTNSRMNSGHGEMNLHWKQLLAKLYYYDNNRQLPGIVRYYTNLSAEQLHERNALAQVRWIGRSQDDRWMLKLNGKVNWSSSQYTDTLVAQRRNDATYWQREYYASAALMWLINEHWAMDYSADWMLNNLNSTLATDVRPHRHGILQSLTAKWTEGRWIVQGRCLSSIYLNGAKLGNAAKNVNHLSPSLSLSYRLLNGESRDELYLRVSYKDIFRVPTFNESYFFHYGSTDLQPEKTQQYNVGLTWQRDWSEKGMAGRQGGMTILLTLDGYINRVRDKIVGVPYNMFVWRTVNLGKVDVQGLDASLKATWSNVDARHHLSLSGSYSYQRVVNHTDRSSAYYGNQVAYIPRHQGSVALGWENPWVNLSLHGEGMSSRWANNNHYEGTEISGFWEMGVTAYRSLKGIRWGVTRLDGFSLRLDIKNLLDKQYELVGHYPMPGRSWQCSISYAF